MSAAIHMLESSSELHCHFLSLATQYADVAQIYASPQNVIIPFMSEVAA